MSVAKSVATGCFILILGGCATVDPAPDYGRAREEVTAATGVTALYSPGEEAHARAQVEELLENGLTSEEAVQVALLNNPGLRQIFFEIGVSRAEAVQAGLLSNPSLDALIRLPVDGGSTVSEGGLLQNLAELWQIPSRKRFAESQVDRTVLDVAHFAVTVSVQVNSAYSSAQASLSALGVVEGNLETAREFLELSLERQAAGAATLVDVNAARSTFLEQKVLVRSAESAALEAKRTLALALGLATRPKEIVLSEVLEESIERTLDPQRLLDVASEHRLDLRSLIMEVEANELAVPMERQLLWRDLSGGLSFESEGGGLALGPSIDLELPVFDQNQAGIAKAEYRYAQALRRLEGAAVQVSQQVDSAFENYLLAQDLARLFRDEILPLEEANLGLARESFAAGKTGFLSVLEAQRRYLRARREYVDHLEAVALSIPKLEAACGRSFHLLVDLGD